MSINDDFSKFLKSANAFSQSKSNDAVISSASRTTSFNSSSFESKGFNGVRLFLDVTASSGTSPTLDVKVQVYNPVVGEFVDLPGAAFAQQTAAGKAILTIYPGIAETANESVSDVIGSEYRVAVTIGGTSPSFTFSVSADYIK